jgi:ABC-type polysaccharide/polyol phosphate transport system ATPase subunit
MLPDGTIAVDSLWKRFHADRSRPVLRDEIERLRNRRRSGGASRWRWALQDINLHIEPGEAVGLFGANGSGKSTLLKILTRVMYPTYGRMTVAGRVGALIEVRAGIHPDLTGRENIYLYGSLLGLTRAEVAKRFDEIVDFAELEEAVDRQLKFYSSGMAMRLGFGVAAFLNPSVLLVDEVLAVGDASFQQKCLSRMRHVLAEGSTLVFVSHDLATVEATCRRGVWLHNGVVQADGPVRASLAAYREGIERIAEHETGEESAVRIVEVQAHGVDGGSARTGDRLDIAMRLKTSDRLAGSLYVGITEGPAAPVVLVRTNIELEAGENDVRCGIESLPLPAGRYFAWAGLLDSDERDLMAWRPVASFNVAGPELDEAPAGIMRLAPIHVAADWSAGPADR